MDLTGQERFLYSLIKMRSIVLFMFLYSKRLIDYSYKLFCCSFHQLVQKDRALRLQEWTIRQNSRRGGLRFTNNCSSAISSRIETRFAQVIGMVFPSSYIPSFATAMELNTTQGVMLPALINLAQMVGLYTFGILSDGKIPVNNLILTSALVAAVASFPL